MNRPLSMMLKGVVIAGALVLGSGERPAYAQAAAAAQSSVTAIDIALEPDTTILTRAAALNARLRSSFPKGYSLDATHRPHVTMLQRYVRTAELSKIYAAVQAIVLASKPAG